MITDVLKQRINDYAPKDSVDQENVLQELMQHYVLVSLARARMFDKAIFHGGTCLRILHGTSRFSEDLDFLLKEPHPDFRWKTYLEQVFRDCSREGISFEVQDKSNADAAVKRAFLKTDSIGKILLIELPHARHNPRKIRIKLEIDTNPPAGSDFETSYLSFPGIAPITTQTLESGFSMKAHALLCRRYVKGRDWFDLVWYISKKTVPNFLLLKNALLQQGPWARKSLELTPSWLIETLATAIHRIDWNIARTDVARFLPSSEQAGIENWSAEFFLYQLDRLRQYIT